MDDNDSPRLRSAQLLLPFILLAVGVLFSLIWQITALQSQRSAFQATRAQLAETIQKREPQVAQAAEITSRLEAFGKDLLDLASTNATAEAIVKKYDIRKNLDAAKASSGAGK